MEHTIKNSVTLHPIKMYGVVIETETVYIFVGNALLNRELVTVMGRFREMLLLLVSYLSISNKVIQCHNEKGRTFSKAFVTNSR